jgi:hypothetical protein
MQTPYSTWALHTPHGYRCPGVVKSVAQGGAGHAATGRLSSLPRRALRRAHR